MDEYLDDNTAHTKPVPTAQWTCKACFFENPAGQDTCERCHSYWDVTPQRLEEVRWWMQINQLLKIEDELKRLNSQLLIIVIVVLLSAMFFLISRFSY